MQKTKIEYAFCRLYFLLITEMATSATRVNEPIATHIRICEQRDDLQDRRKGGYPHGRGGSLGLE
jgi:hypothetical protein